MVIQLPGPLKDATFVTSDRPTVDQSRTEVTQWVTESGYSSSQPERVFTIFDDGEILREWNLVQKDGRHRANDTIL